MISFSQNLSVAW